MKTFIKTIRTITAVLMILAGLTVLFIIDNANDLTTLLTLAVIMVAGVVGGIALLVSTYPELIDLSEFDDKSLNSLEECQKELEECQVELDELREHNLLLINRYITFKSIIKASKALDESAKIKYPSLYYIFYEEDLVCGKTNSQEPSLDELDRFKEIYN